MIVGTVTFAVLDVLLLCGPAEVCQAVVSDSIGSVTADGVRRGRAYKSFKNQSVKHFACLLPFGLRRREINTDVSLAVLTAF